MINNKISFHFKNITISNHVMREAIEIHTSQFWQDNIGIRPKITITLTDREDEIQPSILTTYTISLTFNDEDVSMAGIMIQGNSALQAKFFNMFKYDAHFFDLPF